MATAAEVCCGTCSSGDMIIDGTRFQLTDETRQSYYTQVETEWAKLTLPDIRENVKWTVYKLSPSGILKHFSLFFVYEDTKSPGFTFELVCIVSRRNQVAPKTTVRQRKSGTSKLHLGVIRGSAESIMERGLQCLVEFGHYHTITNNCQNFCRKFAEKLGVEQPWSDGQKIGLGTVATIGTITVGLGGLYALQRLLGNQNEDDDEDD